MKKVIMILSIGLIGLTSCGTGTSECTSNCDSTKVDSVKVDTTSVTTTTVTPVDTTKN